MVFGYTIGEKERLNNVESIYVDSGLDRNNYKRLLEEIRPNDVLVIDSLLVLGDSLSSIIEEYNRLTKELGVKIIVQDMEELNDDKISMIVMDIIDRVVRSTKEKTLKKQLDGINQARENGVVLGRPQTKITDDVNDILDKYINKEITNDKAASLIGVSRATFFRMARVRREKVQGEVK